MWCPKCACEKTYVLNTVKGTANRRFRRCTECEFTFQSIEVIENDEFWAEYAKHILGTEAKEETKQELGHKLIQGSLF